MASKTVAADRNRAVVVQGFRSDPETEGYVFLGVKANPARAEIISDVVLTIEDANVLGEYLRQEAEFAQSVREEGNE